MLIEPSVGRPFHRRASVFTNLQSDNLLGAFSQLFYPNRRADGVAKLRQIGVLTDEAADALLCELADGAYSYRTLFKMLGPIKVELDNWTRSHQYNQFRPTRTRETIDRYAEVCPEAFTAEWLAGKDALDFGAGDCNPLGAATVLYANGARSVTAFEPASWNIEYAKTALRELLAEIHLNPSAFTLPGVDARAVRARLADIDFDRLGDGDELRLGPIHLTKKLEWSKHPRAFDIIFSTSVLEHVRSFDDEIGHHLGSLRPGGMSINVVDFTDHRHAKPEFQPFGFYADAVSWGCNLLRVSDLEAAASKVVAEFNNGVSTSEHGNGFGEGSATRYEIRRRQLADAAVLEGVTLHDRFKHYNAESLLTASAALMLQG